MAINDEYAMTMTVKSQCMHCRHLVEDGKCVAYPDRIPMSIWTAKEKHDRPRTGDHGIQFEPL